jgi:branched-chain amino acid transport system ATP-binding protein
MPALLSVEDLHSAYGLSRVLFGISLEVEAGECVCLLGRRSGHWTIDSVYEIFPKLSELRNRSGGHLSGGEQQMLTIARTLMGNPELLLLDEPSEGLAPLVVQTLLEKTRELKAQGLTILLAEQGVDFSLALADRVYVLEKGSIRHSGPAAELRDDAVLRDRLLTL